MGCPSIAGDYSRASAIGNEWGSMAQWNSETESQYEIAASTKPQHYITYGNKNWAGSRDKESVSGDESCGGKG